jgi:hypothetical protein
MDENGPTQLRSTLVSLKIIERRERNPGIAWICWTTQHGVHTDRRRGNRDKQLQGPGENQRRKNQNINRKECNGDLHLSWLALFTMKILSLHPKTKILYRK